MIIRYPSGLYTPALPQKANNTTSVVYTISGKPPESRSNLYNHVPEGIRRAAKNPKTYDTADRRSVLGNLVFVDSTLVEAKVRSGQPEYKLGQILDFTTDTAAPVVPNYTGKSVIVRHDTARLDTGIIGMPGLFNTPAGTSETVSSLALETYNSLISQIEVQQRRYDVLEANIDSYRKTINELNRTINGLTVILESSGSQSVADTKQELEETKAATEAELNAAILEINDIPVAISNLKDKVNTLAIFVE